MSTGQHRRRRTALLLLGAAVLVVAVLLWGALSSWLHAAQEAADEEAAGYADTLLLDSLNETATSGGDRLTAVESALRPDRGEAPSSRVSVIAGEASGSRIPVVVYHHWDDRSFAAGFPTSPEFGTACRVLTVDDTAVTTRRVECPGTTPEHPFHDYRPSLTPGRSCGSRTIWSSATTPRTDSGAERQRLAASAIARPMSDQ